MNIMSATPSRTVNRIALMSGASFIFAILMGFSSLVRFPVPGSPVPITLQTFVLFVGAGLLQRHYSVQFVLWYLILGCLGLPFFTNGSGWQYLFGATGGYLIGFLLAAVIIGYLGMTVSRGWKLLALYIASAFALYIPGLIQLKFVTGVNWVATLQMGLFPFIIFDVVKATAAWALVKLLAAKK